MSNTGNSCRHNHSQLNKEEAPCLALKKIIYRHPVSRILIIPVFLLLLLQSVYGFFSSPYKDLGKCYEHYKAGEFDKIEDDLPDLNDLQYLRGWGFYFHARYYEHKGDFDKAESAYLKVSEDSGAFLKSRIDYLHMQLNQNTSKQEAVPIELVKLEAKVRTIARQINDKETLAALDLLTALRAYKKLGVKNAAALLLKIPQKYKRSNAGKQALELLIEYYKNDKLSLSRAERLQLYDSLYSHSLRDEALLVLNDLQRQAKERSALANRVQLYKLRHLPRQKHEEILQKIIADKNPGYADEALLKLGQLQWNRDDNLEALENFELLLGKYPQSKHYSKAGYLAGRVSEQMGLPVEAKEFYQKLLKSGSSSAYKIRAAMQLSWLFYDNQTFEAAHKYFNKAAGLAKNKYESCRQENSKTTTTDLVRNNEKPCSNYSFDTAAALFWKSFVAVKKLNNDPATVNEDLHEALKMQTTGYYSMLIADEFGYSEDNFFLAKPDDQGQTVCRNTYKVFTRDFLDALKASRSKDIIVNEVDWLMLRGMQESVLQDMPRSLVRNIVFAKAHYLQKAGSISESARYVNFAGRRNHGGWLNFDSLQECRAKYLEFVAPRAKDLESDINTHANKHSLEPDTVRALIKAESLFDPAAVSPVGARGLMQLMPQTAKMEGLGKKESLFDAKVNIRLGTKHLGRLFKLFNGKPHAAIGAYNAGKEPVKKWLEKYSDEVLRWKESVPYGETRNYIKKVALYKRLYQLK